MYWIPAIFIIVQLSYLNFSDKLIRYTYARFLYDKFKDNDLRLYISNEFKDIEKITNFFGIFILLEFIYFIVAFFYPFWLLSTIYIFFIIIVNIFSKLKKKDEDKEIEKAINYAKLKNFKSSNIKFERLLKLNELKTNKKSFAHWRMYILIFIKIFTFISIIVLHYHYKIL